MDQKAAYDLPPVEVLHCTGVLSIKKSVTELFTITPNPSKGVFDVRVSKNIGNSIISIFDMNGRVVFKEKSELKDVHRVQTNIRSGVYILRVETENDYMVFNSKIIIK